MINMLAISCMHLGVPESVFSSDENTRTFIAQIKHEYFKSSKRRCAIGKLMLLGDYIDLSETWDEHAFSRGLQFMEMFLKEFHVEEVVWIPGNHDHHLWVREVERTSDYTYGLSIKTGVFDGSESYFRRNSLPDWYEGKVTLAYPHVIEKLSKNRTLILHHGHLKYVFEKEKKIQEAQEELKIGPVEAVETVAYRNLERRFYDTKFASRWTGYRISHYIGMWFVRLAPFRFLAHLEEGGKKFIRWYLYDVLEIDPRHKHEYIFVMGHEHKAYSVQHWFGEARAVLYDIGGWVVPIHNYRLDAKVMVLDSNNEVHTKKIHFTKHALNKVFQKITPFKLPDFKIK